MIVVDTLARACSRHIDWNDVTKTTATLAPLQALALQHDLCILCVDHHRKRNGTLADVVDDILGSTAKGAVVDTAWGLYRERGNRHAALRVTGRDIDEREIAVEFDSTTCVWQLASDLRQVAATEAESDIFRALKELKEAHAGPIADYLGKSRPAVIRVLSRLEARGRVVSRKEGRYRLYSLAPAMETGDEV